MRQKTHVLYLFLTLTTVCFITAAPTELLDIYIVDEELKAKIIKNYGYWKQGFIQHKQPKTKAIKLSGHFKEYNDE